MRWLLPWFLLCAACSVSTAPQKPFPKDDDTIQRKERGPVRYDRANDSAEISRGVGAPGSVVVLWPRIVPRSEDPATVELADWIQARLERIAKSTSDSVDRRPSPERVCPKGQGCKGTSLGAVLTTKDKGCAIVALVGPSGTSPVRLVPLAGTFELKQKETPFREPPENAVTVTEFVPCAKLKADLEANAVLPGEGEVSAALSKASGK